MRGRDVNRRRHLSITVVIGFGLVAISACSGAPASLPAPTGSGSTVAAAPVSTAAAVATSTQTVAASPVATTAPSLALTASPTKALPAVDLVLSGDFAVVAKGTAGQCTLGTDSAGNAVNFGFGAVEADYPGLGQGLYVSEGNDGYVTIKWLVDANTAFLNMRDIKGVSTDHHSITIDTDLGGGGNEHLKGTITCP